MNMKEFVEKYPEETKKLIKYAMEYLDYEAGMYDDEVIEECVDACYDAVEAGSLP